ncbi:pilus assembly protein PilP [Oceanospirillum sp.]|uniref:pilus assembly protein PilP n=1 Tax=Oceanospirillum sp. TaxID=2021254 RepID=UPI003A95C399
MIKKLITFLFSGVTLLTLLAGCRGHDDHSALLTLLQDIRNRPPGTIAPLPETLTPPLVHYTGSQQPSPFKLHKEQRTPASSIGADPFTPDSVSPQGVLEQHPLQELSFVGTLQLSDDRTPKAFIDDGHGEVHKVIAGQYMGQNFGRVVKISEDTIYIEETVQDEQGTWVTRPRQLKLVMEADE